jgi:hypothetical protein
VAKFAQEVPSNILRVTVEYARKGIALLAPFCLALGIRLSHSSFSVA